MKTWLVLVAVCLAACGGKVVVETDGQGGGASTASIPSSSGPDSVGTGPDACSCETLCRKLTECGQLDFPCDGAVCPKMPAEVLTCLCEMENCDVGECVRFDEGSAGQTAASTGAGNPAGCPAEQPVAGSPCTEPGLVCTFPGFCSTFTCSDVWSLPPC